MVTTAIPLVVKWRLREFDHSLLSAAKAINERTFPLFPFVLSWFAKGQLHLVGPQKRERKTFSTLQFMFFAPCIVIQLCNVNQQNALVKLMF